MNNDSSKTSKPAVAMTGALAVVSTAAMVLTPLMPLASAQDSTQYAESAVAENLLNETGNLVQVPQVEGDFSFAQGVVSSTSFISDAFNRAAATLCQASPVYQAQAGDDAISIENSNGDQLSATVDTMSKGSSSVQRTLTCACSTNTAGGNAIATANVDGASVQSIAAAAGER